MCGEGICVCVVGGVVCVCMHGRRCVESVCVYVCGEVCVRMRVDGC